MNSQQGRRVAVEGSGGVTAFKNWIFRRDRDSGDRKAMEEAANGTGASESELPEKGTSFKHASS